MKLFIKNRKGQRLAVVVEENENQKGLVFIMHGLGGFKEQRHIRSFAEAFFEKGFTVITFDTANALGESGGKIEKACTTSYYEDLEDIINWSKKQNWHQEPFMLVGSSAGGICVGLYAESFPEKVKALALISANVSGKLLWQATPKEILNKWKKTGWWIQESDSKPGVFKKLSWANMEDALKYNLLNKVENLTMPVLMIAGEKDVVTSKEHQKILFDKIPGPKEFHIIKSAAHTFRTKEHLAEVKKIFSEWIDKI